MRDYMKALRTRFSQEPELRSIREELKQAYRKIKRKLTWKDQEILLQLADPKIEMREQISPAAFISGFQLDMGNAREMEPYNFGDEEEERVRKRVVARYTRVKN